MWLETNSINKEILWGLAETNRNERQYNSDLTTKSMDVIYKEHGIFNPIPQKG